LALVNVSYIPAQAEQQVKLADAELRETKALVDPGGVWNSRKDWAALSGEKIGRRPADIIKMFVFLLHV
jgi:hypothetical protein